MMLPGVWACRVVARHNSSADKIVFFLHSNDFNEWNVCEWAYWGVKDKGCVLFLKDGISVCSSCSWVLFFLNIWWLTVYTEKTWKSVTPCLSRVQAFALPFPRISNAASPRRDDIMQCGWQAHQWPATTRYNTPYVDVTLPLLLGISQSCEVWTQKKTSVNVLFLLKSDLTHPRQGWLRPNAKICKMSYMGKFRRLSCFFAGRRLRAGGQSALEKQGRILGKMCGT